MLNITSGSLKSKFKSIFDEYKLNVSAENIFYHTIRLIKDKYKILDRDTYMEYYENILCDIKISVSPLDCFIPLSDEEMNHDDYTESDKSHIPGFDVNRITADYERIKKRISIDDILNTFPNTHIVYTTVQDKPEMIDNIIDDIFIHFCVYRYLDQIEQIRIRTFSSATPLIEYITSNISLNDLKNFLITSKCKPDKCTKYLGDAFFLPEFKLTKKYYLESHADVPSIDVDVLLQRLVTNIVCKSDIYIIIGIYILFSFAMTDIRTENYDSPCVKYIKDVLSKL